MAKKRKKQGVPLRDKILIPVLAAAVIASGLLLFNYKSFIKGRDYSDLMAMDTIYNNIFINDCEVAGLTKEQALEKLNIEVQQKKLEPKCLYLQVPGGTADDVITLSYKDLGMAYDFAPAIEQAYNYGRTGLPSQRIAAIDELENKGEFYTAEYGYDRSSIVELLKGYEADINSRTKNGKKMDIERTADMISEMLNIDSYDSYIIIPTL